MKRVRLTEAQLHRVIKESVYDVLNSDSLNEGLLDKAKDFGRTSIFNIKQAFNKGLHNFSSSSLSGKEANAIANFVKQARAIGNNPSQAVEFVQNFANYFADVADKFDQTPQTAPNNQDGGANEPIGQKPKQGMSGRPMAPVSKKPALAQGNQMKPMPKPMAPNMPQKRIQ